MSWTDLPTLLSLALTCKHIHSHLEAHHGVIARDMAINLVGRYSYMFAIMAVEAEPIDPADRTALEAYFKTWVHHNVTPAKEFRLPAIRRLLVLHEAVKKAVPEREELIATFNLGDPVLSELETIRNWRILYFAELNANLFIRRPGRPDEFYMELQHPDIFDRFWGHGDRQLHFPWWYALRRFERGFWDRIRPAQPRMTISRCTTSLGVENLDSEARFTQTVERMSEHYANVCNHEDTYRQEPSIRRALDAYLAGCDYQHINVRSAFNSRRIVDVYLDNAIWDTAGFRELYERLPSHLREKDGASMRLGHCPPIMWFESFWLAGILDVERLRHWPEYSDNHRIEESRQEARRSFIQHHRHPDEPYFEKWEEEDPRDWSLDERYIEMFRNRDELGIIPDL
ncbi:hypothetical protein JX266_007728 [Neoarthrinium moseri]|nr:hypothetical protein JX266_007728 [Neoarthrinium moseri]